jgi:methylated-DNA-protein-cysteine methyltransferase related protein
MTHSSEFKKKVYWVVKQIPRGRVMTYGQIAAMCGRPRAARIVGMIAHFGPETLPWHRVVNRVGNMASGYWGGKNQHKLHLEAEGVVVKDYKLDLSKYIWFPEGTLFH